MTITLKKLKRTLLGLIALTFGGLATLASASAASTSTTTNITVSINPVISITSSGTVSLSITPTATGVQSYASDTVTVNTNDVSGYTVTISMSSATTALTSGSNTIPASTGTPAVSAFLTASNSSWGYCTASFTSAACPASNASNQALNTYKFAGVPALASPYQFKTSSTNSSGFTNDTTTVWYGAAANSSQPSGNGTQGNNYTGTVIYTATTV